MADLRESLRVQSKLVGIAETEAKSKVQTQFDRVQKVVEEQKEELRQERSRGDDTKRENFSLNEKLNQNEEELKETRASAEKLETALVETGSTVERLETEYKTLKSIWRVQSENLEIEALSRIKSLQSLSNDVVKAKASGPQSESLTAISTALHRILENDREDTGRWRESVGRKGNWEILQGSSERHTSKRDQTMDDGYNDSGRVKRRRAESNGSAQ